MVTLKQRLEDICTVDEKILTYLKDEGEIEHEILDTAGFNDSVYGTIVEIELILKDFEQKSQKTTEPKPSSDVKPGYSTKLKLPMVALKRFDGDPCKWQTFWESFNSAVHDDSNMPDIMKFHHLNSLLDGKAATTIAGLSISASTYGEAIKLLKTQYGQKDNVIASHMEKLYNLPPVKGKDIGKLRNMFDSMETHVRGLQALGVETEQYDKLLIPLLQPKFPEEIQVQISRKCGSSAWNLKTLIDALRAEIEARERCLENVIHAKDSNVREERKVPRQLPTTATFYAAEKRNIGTIAFACIFCKGQHKTNECHAVESITARRDILRREGRCYICLKRGHISASCRSRNRCYRCKGKHNLAICQDTNSGKVAKESETRKNYGTPSSPPEETTNLRAGTRNSMLLQTAQVLICHPEDERNVVRARVIFDSGSQRSYILEDARRKLNLPTVAKENVVVNVFGNSHGTAHSLSSVSMIIKNAYGRDSSKLKIDALAVPHICAPVQGQEIDLTQKTFAYLKGLKLADHSSDELGSEIQLLIGANHMWSCFTGEMRRDDDNRGPVAMNTIFGWVLSGPGVQMSSTKSASTNLNATHILRLSTSDIAITSQKTDLDLEVQKFWDFDSIGIRDTDTLEEQFERNIVFKDGKYSVNLPFRDEHPAVPDNYNIAVNRLNNLTKRLRKDPEIMKEYDKIITDQLEKGIIEKVDTTKPVSEGKVFYSPHRPVIRKDAITTKLRVVYDASSEVNGISLNDILLKGPSLTAELFSILLRFRTKAIAIVADIEKAFLNIYVDETERDFLRFLWVKDIADPRSEIVVYRFCTILFGLVSSPFIMNATLRHHLKTFADNDPVFVDKMIKSLYCDDLTTTVDTFQDAVELYSKAKDRMAEGNFNLRKWNSNCTEFMEVIRERCEEPQRSVAEYNDSLAKSIIGNSDDVIMAKEH